MHLIPRLLLILSISNLLVAQTTGKITGTIKDAETNEVLIGANIIVDGTYSGAATDIDGTYYILNVKPGTYSLTVNMIGYKQVKMENVRVSVNRTSTINALLEPTVIEGETVIVEVDAITTRKDQTSTIKNISTDQIAKLPVENIGAVVGMQAGVVEGHFRGGRYNEVTYLIDGIQVDEVFGGSNSAVEIEPEVIQDLEIITGTFNAEYGQAMSGIVNIVTKDGSYSEYLGSISYNSGSYLSGDESIFPQISKFNMSGISDIMLPPLTVPTAAPGETAAAVTSPNAGGITGVIIDQVCSETIPFDFPCIKTCFLTGTFFCTLTFNSLYHLFAVIVSVGWICNSI